MTETRREVIEDAELRHLVDQRSARTVVVLVEARSATVDRVVERGHAPISPRTVPVAAPEPGDGSAEDEALVAAVTAITGRVPHHLPAAHAFVVEASGDQLARLAALHSVLAIRPCRRITAQAEPRTDGGR